MFKKSVSLFLILTFLLYGNPVLAQISQTKNNTLAAYSIFQLLEENKEDLDKFTRERTERFRSGEAARLADRLAKKLAARVRELERLVTMEEGRVLLVRQLEEWARVSSVPRSRRDTIIAAVNREFANLLHDNPGSQVGQLLAKLDNENFEGNIRKLYGLSQEEAKEINLSLAKIGYDKSDNRFGWSVAHLNWILDSPEGIGAVEAVLRDADNIRNGTGEDMPKGGYDHVIFLGMGGSGLSVQAVKTTFGKTEGVQIHSLRTTDPAVIAALLNDIKGSKTLKEALEKTLIIPISKSGTTKETVSHKKYFEDLFEQLGLDIKKHMWVVTDERRPPKKATPMDEGNYKRDDIQLNKKGDIGGRFTSPTTRIFLLPLALVAPERVRPILEHARQMNDIGDINQDVYLRLGSYLYYMAANLGKDKVTLIAPEELRDIPYWAEQLFEESLGKGGKGVTIFYGEDLTRDAIKGVDENDRVFVRINLGAKRPQPGLWDTLTEEGYPTFEINLEDINSVGGAMLGLQRTVAAIAYLWDINFVDQPAVDGYKDKTTEVMNALKPGEKVQVPQEWRYASFNNLRLYYSPLIDIGAITEEELKTEVERVLGSDMNNAAAVYAGILRILSRKQPGFEAAEVTSYGKMTPGLRKILEAVRYDIFTRGFQMPSKLGEGPDKNHSYQQNIEDGKNMFFSTYFMPLQVIEPEDLAYGEDLIKAQTIGTVKSMMGKARKVVLITADSTTKEAELAINAFFEKVKTYLEQEKDNPMPTALPAVINDVGSKTREVANQMLIEEIDLRKIAVVMRQDLPQAVTGQRGQAVNDTLQQEYQVMKQQLRKMVSIDGNLVEVATREDLLKITNSLIEQGFRVIVLDDGTLTQGLTENDVRGEAGVNYAVVAIDTTQALDANLLPFVNLNAMTLMGVGILNNNGVLFQSAYRLFTGEGAPEALLEQFGRKALWLIRVLPRIVRLTGNIHDAYQIKKLFELAA